MYSLLISLGVGLLVGVIIGFATPLGFWGGFLIGLVVATVVFVVIARMVLKKITAIMDVVQKDLQANRPEKAIRMLETGLTYARWQFFVKGQIRSQIGMIHFLRREFSTAFEYLKDGFI